MSVFLRPFKARVAPSFSLFVIIAIPDKNCKYSMHSYRNLIKPHLVTQKFIFIKIVEVGCF